MTELSIDQLRRAVQLKEQIDNLEIELSQILSQIPEKSRPSASRGRKARVSVRGNRKVVAVRKTRKRRMSAAARARISAAAKARWKKAKGSGKNSLDG